MPSLRAIVSVPFEDRIQCQQPGCGHAVYRRVHVVDDGGIVLLGSTCFAKRYGSADALGRAKHGSDGSGRALTPAERQLLVDNTAALFAQFDHEQAQRARPPLPLPQPKPQLQKRAAVTPPAKDTSPWPWQKPLTSMLYFRMHDGSGWVRVQHHQGQQLLVPWPLFEGWDECLPRSVGTPHPVLQALEMPASIADLMAAVAYMRQHSAWEKLSGHWREIVGEASRR